MRAIPHVGNRGRTAPHAADWMDAERGAAPLSLPVQVGLRPLGRRCRGGLILWDEDFLEEALHTALSQMICASYGAPKGGRPTMVFGSKPKNMKPARCLAGEKEHRPPDHPGASAPVPPGRASHPELRGPVSFPVSERYRQESQAKTGGNRFFVPPRASFVPKFSTGEILEGIFSSPPRTYESAAGRWHCVRSAVQCRRIIETPDSLEVHH